MEHPKIQAALSSIGKLDPTKSAQPEGETKARGAAFQVLLDRIQSQTQVLHESSKTLDNPSSLNQAVHIARASLDDALSLGDSLLEAFREAQQQDANQALQGDRKNQ